jgi:DNA polymerase-3 subunit epsilon
VRAFRCESCRGVTRVGASSVLCRGIALAVNGRGFGVSELLERLAGGADRFVVVDTETTGVYPTDRIVEVAIVTLDLAGNVVEVWDTLVNPLRDVSATHIHGITATMVRDAPTFEMIAGDVAVRLHGACLVAHNVPFDVRMLVNEFHHAGGELVVLRGIDTYVESGCRLSRACEMFDIDLTGAHRARTDAWATTQLFLQLVSTCDVGSPIAAPSGMARSGQVRRREDMARVVFPEPPLISYLATRLPLDRLEVRQQEYLELVGRAVADLHLDRAERAELEAFASQLKLEFAQIAQAHRRYVNELVAAVIEDNEVNDEEYDTVVRVAAALGVDHAGVEARLVPFRTAGETRTVLTPGMEIVFTGNHEKYERDELLAYAASMGLVPASGVTKRTALVCAADGASTSGKATKARRYGIPVITVDELVRASIGDTVVGTGAGHVGLKVVTCRDCMATWTVPATATDSTKRRCGDCADVAKKAATITAKRVPVMRVVDPWAPPTVEWLTCRKCITVWVRQVSRGRKPHYCPECSGTPILPAPV